jgi:hypothetical protein
MGEWKQTFTIFDFGNRWRLVIILTPRPLYSLAIRPRNPMDRRQDGPQNRSGRPGEEKIKIVKYITII